MKGPGPFERSSIRNSVFLYIRVKNCRSLTCYSKKKKRQVSNIRPTLIWTPDYIYIYLNRKLLCVSIIMIIIVIFEELTKMLDKLLWFQESTLSLYFHGPFQPDQSLTCSYKLLNITLRLLIKIICNKKVKQM